MVWAFPDPGASVPCASYIAVKMQKDTLRRIGTKEITAAVSSDIVMRVERWKLKLPRKNPDKIIKIKINRIRSESSSETPIFREFFGVDTLSFHKVDNCGC